MSYEELHSIESHLESCPACRGALRIALAADSRDPVDSLLMSEGVDCLADETIAALVDGSANPIDREIAEHHVALCPRCAHAVKELEDFAGRLRSPDWSAAEDAAESRPRPISRFWTFGIPTAAALTACAATTILFMVFAVRPLQRELSDARLAVTAPVHEAGAGGDLDREIARLKAERDNLAAANQRLQQENELLAARDIKPTVILSDGGKMIGVDSQGELYGLPTLPRDLNRYVFDAVKKGRLTVSPAARSLAGSRGVLLGSQAEGVRFRLRNPVGVIVADRRPEFRWEPFAGATQYVVTVVDDATNVTAFASPPVKGAAWRPGSADPALERGRTYRWYVTAHKVDGTETQSPRAPDPITRFEVLDSAGADEVDRAARATSRSHLVMGVVYARLGLVSEARREIQRLSRDNPGSDLPRRFLKDLDRAAVTADRRRP